MTNNNKRLLERIKNDKKEQERLELENTKESIMAHSYQLAVIDEIYSCLVQYALDEDYNDVDKEDVLPNIDTLLQIKENLITKIAEEYMYFNHPDRFDFWGYYEGWGGTWEVIQICCQSLIEDYKKEKEVNQK